MARNFKFPTPESCKLKDNAVLCTSDRILSLYNQATGKDQKRITDPVKQWFSQEAQQNGWAGGHFLPEVQSGHGAGCVLFIPPKEINVEVKVTEKTLILLADDENS
ncbi:hypothetical protein [Methylomonas sp. CM2]|uniref:hypothetical protein n=1 Tax=Methylomonas sp. CM2 TaxID=3417647 RepID=UPI003CFA6698